MTLRKVVVVTHRWLGLASALILAVAGATGSIMVLVPQSWLIRRVAGRLHDSLGLGRVGYLTVLAATGVAVVLQLGGAYLWWRRKTVRVRTERGLGIAAFDLHHGVGILGLVMMLVLAATGIARPIARSIDHADRHMGIRSIITQLHTAEDFPLVVKAFYALASAGFLVQGLTGAVAWWKLRL